MWHFEDSFSMTMLSCRALHPFDDAAEIHRTPRRRLTPGLRMNAELPVLFRSHLSPLNWLVNRLKDQRTW